MSRARARRDGKSDEETLAKLREASLWATLTAMRRALPAVLAVLCSSAVALLAASCGEESPATVDGGASSGASGSGSSGGTSSGGPTGLPCDVEKVLADHCWKCHSAPPQFGAPMPLTSHAALVGPAKSDASKKAYELVGKRIHDDQAPMPQAPNPRLGAAELATLDGWIAKGAPSSTETCNTPKPDGGVQPLDCKPDISLTPASPYAMPQSAGNEYVCYGQDVVAAEDKHVIAIAPRVQNAKIVHHILVFGVDSTYPTTPQKCSAGGGAGWRLMYGWAPGGKNMNLPAEAGFPLKKGQTTHYVIQVHYNNAQGLAGETDTSGMDLCTGAPRQYEADVAAFGTVDINIPAHGTLDRTCSTRPQVIDALAGKKLFAAMPHMHGLGTSIDTKLYKGGAGAGVDLGAAPKWDFNTQYWYPIDATVEKGDVIKTRCAWNNTTDQTVKFGENTENEMCYSFTLYYPRVTQGIWNWQAPAAVSTCP